MIIDKFGRSNQVSKLLHEYAPKHYIDYVIANLIKSINYKQTVFENKLTEDLMIYIRKELESSNTDIQLNISNIYTTQQNLGASLMDVITNFLREIGEEQKTALNEIQKEVAQFKEERVAIAKRLYKLEESVAMLSQRN